MSKRAPTHRQVNWSSIEEIAELAGRIVRRKIKRYVHARSREAAARRRGLLDWGRRLLPRHFPLPPSAMHEWLAAELDACDGPRKINCVGPRGGAKSTVGSLAFVLRRAVEARSPYIWLVSDTFRQACAHLENVKEELVSNQRLARRYPGSVGKGPVWRASAIELNNGVRVEAFGSGQRIRGRRRGAHRPSLIVCDDLQNDSHIRSARQREQSREWFHGALLKAGDSRTSIVNLATALHRDALAMELSRTPGWTSRTFRAVERWPDDMRLWEEWEAIYCDVETPDARARAAAFYQQHREAMDQGAVVLWPEAESLLALMQMRAESGRTAFEREKQSSPIDPALCEWPEEYFAAHAWFDEWPAELRVKTMALDPSKGADARRGDYSAFVMLGVDHAGIIYVEADLARRPTPAIVADGVALYRRYQPDAFGLEANQFQDLLGADFADEFQRQGVLAAAPWAIDNRVHKAVRIRRLGPYLSSRRLRFKLGSPSTLLLVNQMRDFPVGDHDDGPDALEMALRLACELQNAPIDDGLGDQLRMA